MSTARRRHFTGRIAMFAALALTAACLLAAPTPPVAADGNEAPGNPIQFRSVTAGFSHTCARFADDTVRCWGENESGQLGLGDTADRGDNAGESTENLPTVNLGTGRTATAITAGYNHTCAILDNGTVKCWGYNQFGQLGLATPPTAATAPARWATTSPPSTSAPDAPPPL